MSLTSKKIYVIAGEASGDLHGANLIHCLRRESKTPLTIYGVGGDKIKDAGVLEFFDLAHFHVTGFTEAIRKIPQYQKASKLILSRIKKIRPELVVLIDNPGFNLHLAKEIHGFGIPLVYYIAPQVWAWAPKRILKIKKYFQKVLVVFQFEEKIYREHGIPVAWVGHPLKDLIEETGSIEDKRKKTSGVFVSLLPGSRKGEIRRLLPIFLKAAQLISEKLPEALFYLLKSPTLPAEFYSRFLHRSKIRVHLVEKNAYETIRQSDLAIVCSGTATLECALLGTPMIISNKGSFITYVALKKMIKLPYLGLPNIILGEKKTPELLQYDATPKKIAAEALQILTDASRQNTIKKDLGEVSKKLGPSGANERAAREVLQLLHTGV